MSERRFLPTAFLIAAVLALLTASSASAAPADLDPTFGSGGISKNALGFGGDSGGAVTVQPDGKTVVVGSSQDPDNTSDDQFVFSRYLDSGVLDPTFGIGGQAAVSFGSGEAGAFDIAIQPDGKILAVGYEESGSDYDMAVTRINSNGTLDAGFRGGGKFGIDVTTGIDDDGKALALAPDGTFYVVGGGYVPNDLDFMILKFKANGDDDTSYSGDGRHFSNFGIGDDVAYAAVVQLDGMLVVAGAADTGVTDDVAVARYTTSGALDATFDGGLTTIPVGSLNDGAGDVAIAPDGKIVLAVSSEVGDGNAFAALRLTSAGLPDPTFDGDGQASFKVGDADGPRGMVLRRDGKILITGAIVQSGVPRGGFVQFNSDGSVDLTFGLGGYVTTEAGTNTSFSDAAQAPDGKVVAAGRSDGDTVVARYLGEYVAPVAVPNIALKTKFSSKLKSKMKAKSLKSISGTAEGTGLAKVQISIGLADKNLLKKKKRCLFVKNNKGQTKKYKAKKKKCAPAKWLTASGTTNWSYKLKGKLKPGKYTIYVRALDANGTTQTSFSKGSGNLKTVTVTK